MVLTDKDGAAIILRNLMPNAPLQNGLTISVENLADGNDDITPDNHAEIAMATTRTHRARTAARSTTTTNGAAGRTPAPEIAADFGVAAQVSQ